MTIDYFPVNHIRIPLHTVYGEMFFDTLNWHHSSQFWFHWMDGIPDDYECDGRIREGESEWGSECDKKHIQKLDTIILIESDGLKMITWNIIKR